MRVLLLAWIALPALAGVFLLTLGNRRSPRRARWVGLSAFAIASVCAALAVGRAGEPTGIAFEWLPGAGRMALEAGASGLYAAAFTTWAGFLVLLGTWSDLEGSSPLSRSMGLAAVALAAACVAFLSAHFVLRYAALEVAALCVACAPLAERTDAQRATLSPFVYLILRFGDAWLLAAIAILAAATGSLAIDPALEAGQALQGPALGWIALGLALAVWVKIGGWPFHVWVRAGSALSLRSRAWLYATVMPNLGLYLLYRTAPLLAAAETVRVAAAWVGAGGAVVAAYLAVARIDEDQGTVHALAAHGGLALLLGAGGLKGEVWIGISALTVLRTLLHLVAGLPARRVRAFLLAAGALATAGWGVCVAFWAGAAGLPAAPRALAEVGVALLIAWAVAVSARAVAAVRARTEPAPHAAPWAQCAAAGALGATLLAGIAFLAPLLERLARASGTGLAADPAALALLSYLAAAPAIWLALPLALIAWRLGWRLPAPPGADLGDGQRLDRGLARLGQAPRAIEVGVLERVVTSVSQGAVRIAEWQRRWIEQGILESGVAYVIRATLGAAGWAWHTVERDGIERLPSRVAQSALTVAGWAWRAVEREGIEALPRRVAQSAFAVARVLQRRHTGMLRRNLLWVVGALVVVGVVVYLAW
ncbi:MAG: hypothetical protein JXA09_08905 [Anaerolineae bacterium]|nr:hypothetical protein [Anaerolineae bacterium]